ncbi:cyclin-domain-containing protein [Peziza echinospora]|nr:cyclin-domain-containing protein [Peziza echinospora]
MASSPLMAMAGHHHHPHSPHHRASSAPSRTSPSPIFGSPGPRPAANASPRPRQSSSPAPSSPLRRPTTSSRSSHRSASITGSPTRKPSSRMSTPLVPAQQQHQQQQQVPTPSSSSTSSSPKRPRTDMQIKLLPPLYQHCETADLVILISDMLGELVGINDKIPLSTGGLTRFHSRAPPTISIPDYLSRLTLHSTLQPSILLSMVYYIDILSTLYPTFTISSLTVHRFLITAATVASKGLCDSFLTNSFYAKVGGVSLMELNLLELEFLTRVGWRIVPRGEVLGEYYQSLIGRLSNRYRIDETGPKLGPGQLMAGEFTVVESAVEHSASPYSSGHDASSGPLESDHDPGKNIPMVDSSTDSDA